MAVAGLHNVSAFGPFFGESQSRQWGDEPCTPTTRASSILQMWRELEGDRVVGPSPRLRGQMSENMPENVDEPENQVVLTGSETDHDDDNSIVSEQSSDLGEIERERVRQIFREWMSSGAVGHSSNGLHLSSRSAPQWLAHPDVSVRRPIRRLCGRQMLLDLLQRAQCERKEELQGLLEQRPVSEFTHRHRIQAFLRGRFLRNERVIPNERPSSLDATELGLLRQRHTVSGLREGFLSRLESSSSTSSANSVDSDSLFGNLNNCDSESTCRVSEVTENSTSSDSEFAPDDNRRQQEFAVEVTQEEVPLLPNVGNEQEMPSDDEGHEQDVPSNIEGVQPEVPNELLLQTDNAIHSVPHELQFETEDTDQSTPLELLLETEDINRSGPHELPIETEYMSQNGPNDSIMASQGSVHTERADSSGESTAGNLLESSANQFFLGTSDNDAVEHDQMQESQEDWPTHDLQEAIDSWLDMPSTERRVDTTFYFSDDDNDHSIELRELFSRRRVSSLLRSSFRESLDQVLQSHVERQGHASGDWDMENASSPSLVEEDMEQQNGDRALGRALYLSDAADTDPFASYPFDTTSTFVTASQPLLDEDSTRLPHNNVLNRHLGTEWEVVNGLRIHMARLQERLNNMQSMLEQCMDMQIELQRSVRQEVSAALNRSILSGDESEGIADYDESQWEYVRRGICCLCHANNIDSLLYRCGHMCTCSMCAEKLIQDTGKCPMCQAPVVEAVRAYFTSK